MKKLLLLLLLVPMLGTAQWSYETVDNGFDEAYKIAYTKKSDGAYLKMENVDGDIVLYVQAFYFCDEDTEVDFSLLVNGKWEKYTGSGVVSNDGTTVFLVPDLVTSEMAEDFKAATTMKIRVRQLSCLTQVFEFNMTGSTKALNYMK